MSNCDGCTNPQGEIKRYTVTGAEGDFCHACRHGRHCNCEDEQVDDNSGNERHGKWSARREGLIPMKERQ